MSRARQQPQEKRVGVLDSSMIQSHRISVFAPLGLSLVALVCTIIIYLVPLRATVNFQTSEPPFTTPRSITRLWVTVILL